MADLGWRTKALIGVLLAVAFAVGMAAQMTAFGDDTAGGPDLELRLVPNLGPEWTVRGHDVVRAAERDLALAGFSVWFYGRGPVETPFANDDLVVALDRTPESQRGGVTGPATVRVRGVDGIVRPPTEFGGTQISWDDVCGLGVTLSSMRRSVEELAELAEQLDLDAAAPLGFDHDGLSLIDDAIPSDNQIWSASAQDGSGATVRLQVGDAGTWTWTVYGLGSGARPVGVRGADGLIADEVDHRHLIWQEDGLVMDLSGPFDLDLVAIADGLREVDAETWAELSADR